MARRKIYSSQHVTNAGVPFTARVQYDPDYREYRATCFTSACTLERIEDCACYDDKESIMGTLRAMITEFEIKHHASSSTQRA